jgi:hypothetical protein
MNAQVLNELLNRRPFDPFRVRLSNGDVFDVRHPEAALLLRTGLYIALPADNGDLPDRAVYCALLHIAAVESVATT